MRNWEIRTRDGRSVGCKGFSGGREKVFGIFAAVVGVYVMKRYDVEYPTME